MQLHSKLISVVLFSGCCSSTRRSSLLFSLRHKRRGKQPPSRGTRHINSVVWPFASSLLGEWQNHRSYLSCAGGVLSALASVTNDKRFSVTVLQLLCEASVFIQAEQGQSLEAREKVNRLHFSHSRNNSYSSWPLSELRVMNECMALHDCFRWTCTSGRECVMRRETSLLFMCSRRIALPSSTRSTHIWKSLWQHRILLLLCVKRGLDHYQLIHYSTFKKKSVCPQAQFVKPGCTMW